MLDIRLIREKTEYVKERLRARRPGEETTIDLVLEIDQQRRAIIAEAEKLKAERNSISKEVGVRKKNGQNADDLLDGMKDKSDHITQLDHELAGIEEAQQKLILTIPNLPHPACPVGGDAASNPVIHQWGERAVHPIPALDHVALGEKLGLFDFPGAATISGSGFVVFRGPGARLERALINFLLDLQTQKHGYLEIATPVLVRENCMTGTGQLPKFREDMYRLEGEDHFLAPTAEVPVTNLLRESLLKEDELPKRFAAYTPCFRREAGSTGRDNRGMTRMHQFDKIELVKVVHPDTSYDELESLRRDAETVLELLGLHYRTIELCTGDIGFGAAKCYDLEVWAPGAGTYLEVSSCSNFEDFQARRMNLRFKDSEGKNRFCHTLNGSGTALPRLYIALLETYQQPDGSILLPEVLHPYYGADRISVP